MSFTAHGLMRFCDLMCLKKRYQALNHLIKCLQAVSRLIKRYQVLMCLIEYRQALSVAEIGAC